MNNRWGKQVESKGSLRSSGQNNINININFNALKDKPNVFGGKKIDNFIEINNQPKQNISRPNVSMQTLKQKKKKTAIKQQMANQYQLQRKKSKSKITNEIFTPQKIFKQRQSGNSKSIGKKSTKKRSAKSFDNLKKFYGKQSPRNEKYQQISQSRQNSKDNSRSKSKSRSRSKSNKKLFKDSSKSKIPTNSTNTRVKNSSHNSKKDQQQQKNTVDKIKKNNKAIVNKSNQGSQTPVQNTLLNKKNSLERISRKKSKQQEQKKQLKIKTPRKRSKSKQSKSLKRLPLFYEQQQQVYNEDTSYKKIQKQAHNLLYEQNISHKKNQKQKKENEFKRNQTSYLRYLQRKHTYQDLKKLHQASIMVQKMWRGYRVRSQFINQLNMMNHKIQITRNKIANLDPKFWDDAQSNSILKAQDAESIKSSEVISELKSDMQKPISQHSSLSKDKMSKNRIIQFSSEQQQMLQRISKLEQNLKKYQVKAQKLQQENKQLKTNLQKVSINSGLNSGFQSMQESLKSQKSFSGKVKYEQDPFFEQQKQKQQQFQLRLPKKVFINQATKQAKNRQTKQQKNQNEEASSQLKNDIFKKYKNRVQQYECSSPKYTAKVNINSEVLELFQKKQDQLKQSFEKKVNFFDRMLNDNIFSPRTYTLKKNQLQQKFRQQAQNVKRKKQIIAQAAQCIKEIEEQQPKIQKQKPKQQIKNQIKSVILQQNHIIQDYGNINLNSHRSKQSEQADQFEQSIESQKSNKQSIFKKKQQKKQPQNLENQIEIQQRNPQVIRIFQQVSQYHKNQNNIENQKANQHLQKADISSSQPQNNSQVSLDRQIKQPKGLQTTLLFIRQYCTSFIQFIESSQRHKTTFIEGICTPIVYDSFQFLKSYRTTITHENDSSYNSQQKQYIYPYFKFIYPRTQVITREAFSDFNQDYNKLQGQCFYEAQRQFFLNSLLDAFNQSIDYKRPCSIYGEPPSWISQFRALKNYPLRNQDMSQKQTFIESQKFNQICGSAIARVIEWATSLCGFIPQSPEMQNLVIQQQQINHIRETRIALMLQKDLLESQQGILDSAIQQTQVKLQLSQIFTQYLITQLVEQLKNFSK